ncbi:redox-regulated ATPase YchF [Candidatus Woesearchaeota archaeon]|nr:redox-regulated ATPase YchF [Candidatus Woesearchaeota archaeon]
MLIGVVGKPNSGKSTFFKALTLAEVEIGNRPFVTIKPNTGVGYVKTDDVAQEFNKLSNPRDGFVLEKYRFVPVQILDVAGLVPGAHEGKGLGLAFLNDLNQADLLIHIVDVSGSTNETGSPVKPLSYNPANDIKFLEKELDYWFLSILKKGWTSFSRSLVSQENQNIKKALAKQLSGLKVTEDIIEEAIKNLKLVHHPLQWSEEDLLNLSSELRKKTKPIIIAANKIDIEGSKYNLDKLKQEFSDYIIIPCSAESELALREAAKHNLIKYIPGENKFNIINDNKLTDQQKKALNFIREKILKEFNSTGIQEILDLAVFKLLKYIAVFPGGVNKLEDSEGRVLPDCFLMPENSTALDFAYKLHSEIGKKFIRAIDVRTKRVLGKEYKLKNKDIIEIIIKK